MRRKKTASGFQSVYRNRSVCIWNEPKETLHRNFAFTAIVKTLANGHLHDFGLGLVNRKHTSYLPIRRKKKLWTPFFRWFHTQIHKIWIDLFYDLLRPHECGISTKVSFAAFNFSFDFNYYFFFIDSTRTTHFSFVYRLIMSDLRGARLVGSLLFLFSFHFTVSLFSFNSFFNLRFWNCDAGTEICTIVHSILTVECTHYSRTRSCTVQWSISSESFQER